MSQQFGKPPETPPETSDEAPSSASSEYLPFSKHGVITGILVFAGFSFLLSLFALRDRPDQLTGANAPSPSEVLQFSSNLSSQYELIERELGPTTEAIGPEGKAPTPEETAQFIKEMPDRFADVASKLDAQSRRESSDGAPPQKPAMPRNASREDINNLAANARSEFKDVNAALGVSSSATDLEAPAASAIPWADLGSADLDDISPAEKQKIAAAAIAQTADAFQQILPLHEAPGITLFAVEATHTVMHSPLPG